MGLVETKPNISEYPQLAKWVISSTEEQDKTDEVKKSVEASLHLISEISSKYKKRKIFKEIYQNIMEQNPNTSYQEKLDFSSKYISDLQEQNQDIHPNIFKSMKRSFAAKTGYEITKFRKELKNAESTTTLNNGKEFHYKHPWSYAIDHVLGQDRVDRKAERSTLIKIIDFRTKLKTLIHSRDTQNPDEMLKICENHIADLIKNKNDIYPETFLNDDCIDSLLNPKRAISSKYMSPEAAKCQPQTLDSLISTVIKNYTQA